MSATAGIKQPAGAVALDLEALDLLEASIERYGRDKYSFEARKALLGHAPGFSLAAWQDYADMGWLAAHLPLDAGGFGGDPRAIAALMRYAGQHLAQEPLFASVVLCGAVLAACDSPAAHMRLVALATGSRVFALAHAEALGDGMEGDVDAVVRDGCLSGHKTMVLHGDVADELVVSARTDTTDASDATDTTDATGTIALYAIDTGHAGVRRTSLRLLDGRGAASFIFDAVPVTALGAHGAHRCPADAQDAKALLDAALDHARLALCAEAHGAMRALKRDTLAYLKTRRQFGRPLGSNQVLQHRMAEMYMLEQESAAVISAAQRALMGSASGRAAGSAGDQADVPTAPDVPGVPGVPGAPGAPTAPDARARRAISGAVAHCIDAGRQISHEAVQLHGGIGMTDELAVSHYFKRIMVLNRLLGDRDACLDAFAAADAACMTATVAMATAATAATAATTSRSADHAVGSATPAAPRA